MAGNLSGAREKFARCLKPPVDRNQLNLGPLLLQEVVQHLETNTQLTRATVGRATTALLPTYTTLAKVVAVLLQSRSALGVMLLTVVMFYKLIPVNKTLALNKTVHVERGGTDDTSDDVRTVV